MIQNETKAKAYKYYCKGLNSREIAKLLDLNFRTVQQIMNRENWKSKRTATSTTELVHKHQRRGLSYNEIAKALGISRSTVYKHLKTSSNGIQ